MTTFPTPPTVMPSVGAGTGASSVQVPCAYPARAAPKVASAPATSAISHFRRVQQWLSMWFLLWTFMVDGAAGRDDEASTEKREGKTLKPA